MGCILCCVCVFLVSQSPIPLVDARKYKTRIAIRDYDFVGEDPVLAAELKRRFGETRSFEYDKEKEKKYTISRRYNWWDHRVTDPYFDLKQWPYSANAKKNAKSSDSRASKPKQGTESEITWGKVEKGDTRQPEYLAYRADWNATNLYAMHLKVAEQTIYAVQDRLVELDEVMEPYQESPLARMAFILKRLDLWMDEMHDFFHYSHKKLKKIPGRDTWHMDPLTMQNPWLLANIRHIYYYEAIIRRYFDMVYAVDYIRKLHGAEVEKNRKRQKEYEELLKYNVSNANP